MCDFARMNNLKEKVIVSIFDTYGWNRKIPQELKEEIDEMYENMGHGGLFTTWLSTRIWIWLVDYWMNNDADIIPNIRNWKDWENWDDFDGIELSINDDTFPTLIDNFEHT